MTEHKNENVTILPRGGYLVDTPVGYIQFGSPPETIKDTMRMQRASRRSSSSPTSSSTG